LDLWLSQVTLAGVTKRLVHQVALGDMHKAIAAAFLLPSGASVGVTIQDGKD
jgi:hypothetical protein